MLQGKVITPSGTQPTTPVRVKLTFNGRAIHETFTDLSGRFSFPGLSRGTYQLTAEGDGVNFETTTVYAEISAFGRIGAKLHSGHSTPSHRQQTNSTSRASSMHLLRMFRQQRRQALEAGLKFG